MAKALDLIDKINKLSIDEARGLYAHHGLHKPLKSLNPLTKATKFAPATPAQQKQFGVGNGTMIKHTRDGSSGALKQTQIITPSASSPSGFDHQKITYHTSGPNMGQIKSTSTKALTSKQAAMTMMYGNSADKLGKRMNAGKNSLVAYGKNVLKDIAKSMVPGFSTK